MSPSSAGADGVPKLHRQHENGGNAKTNDQNILGGVRHSKTLPPYWSLVGRPLVLRLLTPSVSPRAGLVASRQTFVRCSMVAGCAQPPPTAAGSLSTALRQKARNQNQNPPCSSECSSYSSRIESNLSAWRRLSCSAARPSSRYRGSGCRETCAPTR